MPRFKVTGVDGSVGWVDADDEAGVRRHLGHPSTVFLKGLVEPAAIELETNPTMPPLEPAEVPPPSDDPADPSGGQVSG